MEQTGPPPLLVGAIEILIALAIIVFAVWRGERARSQRADELTRVRTITAYWCFLAWGAFVSLVAAVALVSEPMLELVGIFGALPVAIVGIVGVFHTLMLWRVRLIQVLVLVTILIGVLAATAPLPDRWLAVIAAGYGISVIVMTARGLRALRTDAAS